MQLPWLRRTRLTRPADLRPAPSAHLVSQVEKVSGSDVRGRVEQQPLPRQGCVGLAKIGPSLKRATEWKGRGKVLFTFNQTTKPLPSLPTLPIVDCHCGLLTTKSIEHDSDNTIVPSHMQCQCHAHMHHAGTVQLSKTLSPRNSQKVNFQSKKSSNGH